MSKRPSLFPGGENNMNTGYKSPNYYLLVENMGGLII